MRPVLRDNFVLIDFIGFLGSLAPCFQHEDLAHGVGHTVSQSTCLHMVQQIGRDPDSRTQTAAYGLQAQVEETDNRKLGPAVLVFDLKSLERMEIRADYSKARNGHPLEAEEVPGVLEEKISWQAGQTHHPQ
jgi:hypothetical protein